MTDQLFLSIWLDRQGQGNRLRHFERLLRLFPFSQREQPQSTAVVQAIDTTEPPLIERPFNGPFDIEDILPMLKDVTGGDVAHSFESWWDLWQFRDDDWKLAPARVALYCFGPEFDNGTDQQPLAQEDLRIDFGLDSYYLPQPDLPEGARLIESNIKSLLRLVHELDTTLPVASRLLETESGENFAERLQHTLTVTNRLQ